MKLLHCPYCNFNNKIYKQQINKINNTTNKKSYSPIIYLDKLLKKFIIKCPNCGILTTFDNCKEDAIELWNKLIRNN